MIKASHLSKKFGPHVVLDDITCSIEAQEFVSIIGPSGAGKSTLLHLIIGAEYPSSGMLLIDDVDAKTINANNRALMRRKIGMVFQDYKLLPYKTVEENVAFALEVCGYHDDFIRARTNEVLKLVGLYEVRRRFPHELSGGEKQKTALARALVNNPPLLIADEPTGNLDPDATEELIKLFQKINKMGTTVILATHNEKIVDTVKRRVIELRHGRIVKDRATAGYRDK